MITLIACTILAYLLGSLSFAILLCRFYGLPDPRVSGSNNPGATNVMRMGSKSVALQVFALDSLKGLAAVLVARYFHLEGAELGAVAFAAVIGHMYPCFFDFKGGKGVATLLGVSLGLHWILALIFGVIWLLFYQLRGYSSLASLIAVSTLPFASIFVNKHYCVPLFVITLLVIFAHRENISRLYKGNES